MSRVQELEVLIIKHKSLYYSGSPEISDQDYDKLEEELKHIDPNNKVLNLVGSKMASTDKVAHEQKMLSLDKVYDRTELKEWIACNEVIAMEKIDGVSCSLIYENGSLVMAKTRGDGRFGENITDKVAWMPSVPKSIEAKEKIEVRGELFCRDHNFLELSEEMAKKGLDRPSSQRNIVAGLMGRKEDIYFSQYIEFFAFDLIGVGQVSKESHKFGHLKSMNFKIPEINHIKNIEDINLVLDEAETFMSDGDYQIDGVVFVIDDIQVQNGLGETSHHPKYKIAFKYQGDTKTTKIEKIIWSVSRNGVLTPVAEVVPTELSGATISRVTLHNYGQVKASNLKVGDEIEIIRSGEVIPKYLRTINEASSELFIPAVCPSCHEKITIDDIRLICTNENCPEKIIEKLVYFVQKIGIQDLSLKRIQAMLDEGIVKSIPDLYRLKVEDFLKLPKTKEKMAEKLFQNIQATREIDLVTFLTALGITGGGRNKCEKIVQYGIDSIDKVLGLTVEQLTEIDSFAEKSSEEFIKSIQERETLINELIDVGVNFKQAATTKTSVLANEKICITGTLTRKRSEIEKLIKDNGGVVVSSVTGNTTLLLTNDTTSSSSKFKKAEKLGIEIITEEKLVQRIGS